MASKDVDFKHGIHRKLYQDGYRSGRRVNKVSFLAEAFLTRLILAADDFGQFPADLRDIRVEAIPHRPEISDRKISQWLDELEGDGLILRYQVGNERFGTFVDSPPQPKRGKKFRRYPPPPNGDAWSLVLDTDGELSKPIKTDQNPKLKNVRSIPNPNPNPNPNTIPSPSTVAAFAGVCGVGAQPTADASAIALAAEALETWKREASKGQSLTASEAADLARRLNAMPELIAEFPAAVADVRRGGTDWKSLAYAMTAVLNRIDARRAEAGVRPDGGLTAKALVGRISAKEITARDGQPLPPGRYQHNASGDVLCDGEIFVTATQIGAHQWR